MNSSALRLKYSSKLLIAALWSLTVAWGALMGYQEYPSFEPTETYINPSLPRTLDTPRLVACLIVGAAAGQLAYFITRGRENFFKALLIGFVFAALLIPAVLDIGFQIVTYQNALNLGLPGFEWDAVLARVIVSSIWQIPLALVGTVLITVARRFVKLVA